MDHSGSRPRSPIADFEERACKMPLVLIRAGAFFKLDFLWIYG